MKNFKNLFPSNLTCETHGMNLNTFSKHLLHILKEILGTNKSQNDNRKYVWVLLNKILKLRWYNYFSNILNYRDGGATKAYLPVSNGNCCHINRFMSIFSIACVYDTGVSWLNCLLYQVGASAYQLTSCCIWYLPLRWG